MVSTAASTIAPPLAISRTQKVHEALDGLTPAQLQWVNAYIAGLAAQQETSQAPVARTAADPAKTLTILCGLQTGNGRGVAEDLKHSASSHGLPVNLVSPADYKPANIKRESLGPLFARYANERTNDERFGDFLIRIGAVAEVTAGKDFHHEV